MISQKVAKFICIDCNYSTNKRSSWNKHINTKKHNSNINKVAKKKQLFKCETCQKEYKSYVGLWKHKKKHYKNDNTLNVDISKNMQMIDVADAINKIAKEVKNLKPQTINNNNCNQINKNNISINVFLNTHCKNAMNLTDFIDNLKFTLEDVISTHSLGYSKSTANVFIKGLEDMPITKRPIHCTNKKMGTLYIKDNNKWEVDNGKEGSKAFNELNKLRMKSYLSIVEWEKSNPDWLNDPKKMAERCKLVEKLTGGTNMDEINKNNMKLIKEISSKVLIKSQIDELVETKK